MPLKLFEFLEQFMIGTFLIIKRIWENWINKKASHSAGKYETQIELSILEVDYVFMSFTLLRFDSGVFLPFNK